MLVYKLVKCVRISVSPCSNQSTGLEVAGQEQVPGCVLCCGVVAGMKADKEPDDEWSCDDVYRDPL